MAKLPSRLKTSQQRNQQAQFTKPVCADQLEEATGTQAADAMAQSAADGSIANMAANTQQELSQLQQLQPGAEESYSNLLQEQPILPVTWVSYKGDGSSRFRLWVGGQAAGQVNQEIAWLEDAHLLWCGTSAAVNLHNDDSHVDEWVGARS